jgi:hypothetical protein
MHTTHALPTSREWAANVMLVGGKNLALLLGYRRIIPRLKKMGLKVNEKSILLLANSIIAFKIVLTFISSECTDV